MELVTRNYWSLKVIRDIEKYVDSCNICQKIKSWRETSKDGSLFLWRINLKKRVILELKMADYLFSFHFIFILFYFLILNLGLVLV